LIDIIFAIHIIARVLLLLFLLRFISIFRHEMQACFGEGVQSERTSKINLVDLAGSERFTVSGLATFKFISIPIHLAI
jgi:hypothetical protein